MDMVAAPAVATLWFVYAIAVTPDGTAAITPPNYWMNAPTREECLDKAIAWASDLAAATVGPMTYYGTCLELDAALAGETH